MATAVADPNYELGALRGISSGIYEPTATRAIIAFHFPLITFHARIYMGDIKYIKSSLQFGPR
jgi:hypothetical protein